MAETLVRKIALSKIKGDEEFQKNNEDLQYYLEEHRWFVSHDSDESRIQDIDKKLDEYREKLGEAKDREERKQIYSDLHALKVKYLRVKNGTYDSVLRNNIKAEMIMLDEYDTRRHKIPFGKVVMGLLKGDANVKEYARKKLVFALNNSFGMVEKPYDLKLEPNATFDFFNDFRSSLVDTNTAEFDQPQEEKGLTVYALKAGRGEQTAGKVKTVNRLAPGITDSRGRF